MRGRRRGRWQERAGRAGGSSVRSRSAGGRARGHRRGRVWARGQLGGRRARGRAQQAWASGALGVGARGALLGRCLGVAWALGAQPGLSGAVHLVHLAIFGPV